MFDDVGLRIIQKGGKRGFYEQSKHFYSDGSFVELIRKVLFHVVLNFKTDSHCRD